MRKSCIAMLIIVLLLMSACHNQEPTTHPQNGTTQPTATDPTATHSSPTGEGTHPTAPTATETAPIKPTDPTDPTEPSDPTEPPTTITPTMPDHLCYFNEAESVNATCTQEGYVLYKCDCGNSFQSFVGLAEHQYQMKEQVEATDTEEAYTLYECSECGATQKVPLDNDQG